MTDIQVHRRIPDKLQSAELETHSGHFHGWQRWSEYTKNERSGTFGITHANSLWQFTFFTFDT